jgi:hypothetical protein
VAESDSLAGCVGQRRPDIWRVAIVLDEGDNVNAVRQHEEPLFEAHEQVINLPGLVLGFVLLDFTNGKGMQFSMVAEENPVASVSLLQRRHVSALRSITATSGKQLYQLFTTRFSKAKGKD